MEKFIAEHFPGDIVQQTKELYEKAHKARSFESKKSQALPELIVDGFDTEQIWQQIELENNEVLGRYSLENISKVISACNQLDLSTKKTEKADKQSDDSNNNEEEEEHDDNDDSDEEEKELQEKKHQSKQAENNSVKDKVKRKIKQSLGNAKKMRKTEVDDKFFHLDEMHQYLTKIEKSEMSDEKEKKSNKFNQDDEDDDDNMSIDMFNDIPDETDDEGSNEEIKTGKSVKYGDFFDSPEGENKESDDDLNKKNDDNNEVDDNYDDAHHYDDDDDDDDDDGDDNDDDDDGDDNDDDDNNPHNENDYKFNDKDNSQNIEDEEEHESKKQKKVKFNLLDNSDDSDSEKEEVRQKDKNENKSSFEARKERLKKKIEALEKEAVSEKPWQLKGETTASTRPKNSLLEEYVEFDTGIRPAPIMTEKTTMKLEDIIRLRIKDKAWDDVEKKFKPVETPSEYKKKLVMNQEKSKESLAQIYENEYIKQREALSGKEKEEEEAEPKEHIEIREEMHSLFRKLDALSNFHYTPKLAKPEIKIVSNIPAINMEEVAPISSTNATLLAPEEIKSKPRGDLLGKSERNKTDKKRERRKKKLKQHKRAVYQSKKEANGDQKDTKNRKNSKTDVPKVTGRNILKVTESTDQQALKSSSAFFTKLQNEVSTVVKKKTDTNKFKKKQA